MHRIDTLAIDVGFFSTKYSFGRDGGSGIIRADLFPSEAARLSGPLRALPQAQHSRGVVVQVRGVLYFVGPDVLAMVNGHGSRAVTADYSLTPSYHALFLGALAHACRGLGVSGQVAVEHLVVGLPLSTIHSHFAALQALCTGEHRIDDVDGSPLVVQVRNTQVVAQPQGALMSFSVGRGRRTANRTRMVLDMGGGTFDWFVASGPMPHPPRCGAAPIGMLACAQAVCDAIEPQLRHNPHIVARVDAALRCGSHTVRIRGEEVDITAHQPVVSATLGDAIEQMRKSVGAMDDLDTILLSGGGAGLLRRVLAQALPQCERLLEMDGDPVFANVRGFHLIGEFLCSQRKAA